jgi:polyisoprenyl-teichoic acid--peptidoglycan teichoic acid transferase
MKKVIYSALIIFALLILAFGGYVGYLFYSFNKATDNIHDPLDRGEFSAQREAKPELDGEDPVSILLLGVDAEDGERGRSDTIMVLTINPAEESSYLLSIPRDTRTTIAGRGIEDKINHAYAFGGPDMTIETVEQFLDIPIDYYASVDMDGFVSLIDIMNGVSVEVEQSFEQSGYEFTPGEMHMDGETALAYSRNRHDTGGDLSRNERQQQIINALIDEAVSFQSIWKIDQILNEVEENVRTNQDKNDMDNLRKHYLDAARSPERLTLEGEGQKIENIWYLIVSEEERSRVSNILREHLELD